MPKFIKQSIDLKIHISGADEDISLNQNFSIVIENDKNYFYNIGFNAFAASFGLQAITFPAGLMSISDYAFNMCRNLRSITFKNITPPAINGEQVFKDVPLDCQIFIPPSADKKLWLSVFLNSGFRIIEENIIFENN